VRPMSESQFELLERKIDDLIGLCTELNRENVALKGAAAAWRSEREALVSRNELARHKVRSIITRLQDLGGEQGQ